MRLLEKLKTCFAPSASGPAAKPAPLTWGEFRQFVDLEAAARLLRDRGVSRHEARHAFWKLALRFVDKGVRETQGGRMNYCKILVGGRLTRDPETKTTPSGKTVCAFALAVNRKYGDREEVVFLDCEAWERTADVVAKYVHKGDPLFVEGRLRQEQWTSTDGTQTKRSRLVVVVEAVQLLGTKGNSPAAPAAQPAASQAAAAPAPDDIPF